MGDFSADWLTLREPVDARSRASHLVDRLLARWPAPTASAAMIGLTRRILDLGCGTGANLRYLAPRLGATAGVPAWRSQAWLCLDKDPLLLAELERRTRPGAAWARGLELSVRTLRQDLAAGLGPLPLIPGTLVTASALLDLVSADWLGGLLRACAGAGSPLLLALTYDGRLDFTPAHPLDGTLIALFNAHQRRDKGLGAALGPQAPAHLASLAAELGFAVEISASDWVLGSGDAALAEELIQGWATAAMEQADQAGGTSGGYPGRPPAWVERSGQGRRTATRPDAARLMTMMVAWREARLAQNATGLLRIRVGHQDALLLPGIIPDQ
jgi:SAM-dependent methyltransferase